MIKKTQEKKTEEKKKVVKPDYRTAKIKQLESALYEANRMINDMNIRAIQQKTNSTFDKELIDDLKKENTALAKIDLPAYILTIGLSFIAGLISTAALFL